RVLLAADGPLTPRESDGWVLPGAAPVVPSLRQLGGAAPVLDDLGLAQELVRQSAGPQGGLQILGESLRLSLPADAARRREELRPEAAARQAATLLRAPLRRWGGAGQVWEVLRAKAEASGTHVLAGRCARLRIERRGASFELEGAEVRANVVALATSPPRIAELCEGGGRVERNLIEESNLAIARKVALVHFVVHSEAIPQGLEEAALLFSAEGPALVACHPARRARG